MHLRIFQDKQSQLESKILPEEIIVKNADPIMNNFRVVISLNLCKKSELKCFLIFKQFSLKCLGSLKDLTIVMTFWIGSVPNPGIY